MNLLNFMATSGTAEGADTLVGGGWMGMIGIVIPLALMLLVFWFMIIRPEKKRTRELQNMLNNLQIADEVVTNGGIIGLVVSVQDDTVLIETGSNRTKIRVLKSAIAKCNTTHDDVAMVNSKSKKDIK